MVVEGGEVEIVLGDDGGHAGAAVTAGHGDAVDIGLERLVELADGLLDLRGRYVLALPAEGVTDAVDKIEIAVAILAHKIAGAEPDVAFLKDVAQNLFLGLCGGGIAFEAR